MQRNESLDALRGLAILAMVLSGSIAFGGLLPAWMYHAQVPPPQHKFDPSVPGITWVDLVFPFFLFSMGAAIPLALNKWRDKPGAVRQVWKTAVRRFVLLTWFALFILHMRAWVISPEPGNREQLLSILAFLLLFGQLYDAKQSDRRWIWRIVRVLSYVAAVFLLWRLPFHNGEGFRFDKSDIIILVLANMAFFGTIAWWYTRNNPLARLAVLPVLLALILGARESGSWNQALQNWSPLPWMYQFYYLKYLFIIIPGTFAGEWMLRYGGQDNVKPWALAAAGWVSLLIVVLNTAWLYERRLTLNLLVSLALMAFLAFYMRRHLSAWQRRMVDAGSYSLLLGLALEAFEGGIRKDSSTFSYYFVTAGLAFFMLVFLDYLQRGGIGRKVTTYLGSNGRNPMVAYVAGSLLLTPVLKLTGAQAWLDALTGNAWQGFLKGLIYTAAVSLITWYFTRRRWFWKS